MLLKKKQKPRLTFNSGLVLFCVEKLVYFSCLPLATFSCPSSTFVSTSHIILLNENMKKSGVVSIQGMSTLKALYFYNNYVNVAHILLQSNPYPPNWFRIAFGDSSQGYLLQEV